MKQPQVAIEIRPRLQSCQVYYLMKDEQTNNKLVSVYVQDSAITFKCDSWEENFVFDNLKLKPSVLNELEADEENIIACRLQIHTLVDENNIPKSVEKFIPQIEKGKPVQLFCRFCRSILLKNETAFSRILPLPSSDFNSGDLFCHECCNDDFGNQHKMDPKLCDLLYGSYFYKVNCDLLCDKKTSIVRDIIYCQQCKNMIGSKDNVSIILWNCTVAFDGDVDSEVTPKGDFVCMIRAVMEDNVGTMCKIIISCKNSSATQSEYLLIWIMDRSLPLLISCDGSDKLVKRTVIKLLYSHEKSRSLTVSQWQKDMNTHTLDVAEIMFKEGLHYLKHTNCMFPKMFRQANNMNVGYLELKG